MGLEASKLNSRLNCMLKSRSGLSGSCEELARSLCARCSGAIGFAQAPARRAVISAAPLRRSRTSTLFVIAFKQTVSQSCGMGPTSTAFEAAAWSVKHSNSQKLLL